MIAKFVTLLEEPLDLYCERIDASLLSEPWNLYSNLTFPVLAILGFILFKQSPRPSAKLKMQYLLMASIGLGSAWFHSSATRLSQIGDVLPIFLFVFVSLGAYLKLRMKEGAKISSYIAYSLLCLALTPILIKLSGMNDYLAKGEAYLGIIPTLILLAISEDNRSRRKLLFFNAGLFAIALVFRTLDSPICDIFPTGTHFLWHMTTAFSAFLMIRVQELPSSVSRA